MLQGAKLAVRLVDEVWKLLRDTAGRDGEVDFKVAMVWGLEMVIFDIALKQRAVTVCLTRV